VNLAAVRAQVPPADNTLAVILVGAIPVIAGAGFEPPTFEL
jgi:hypothetical protein